MVQGLGDIDIFRRQRIVSYTWNMSDKCSIIFVSKYQTVVCFNSNTTVILFYMVHDALIVGDILHTCSNASCYILI